MSYPSHPSRYPANFRTAVEKALTLPGGLFIPTEKPDTLRVHLFRYLAALRKHGDALLADAVMISKRDGGVLILARDATPVAAEIASALAALEKEVSPPPSEKLPLSEAAPPSTSSINDLLKSISSGN